MKHVIPRNREISDPSLDEIINSGSLLDDKAGKPAGHGIVVYRGSNPRLPAKDVVPLGQMYMFQLGLVYLPGKIFSLLEHAKEPFEAALPLLSFGLSDAMESLPLRFEIMADRALEHALTPPILSREQKPQGLIETFFAKPHKVVNAVEYSSSPELQSRAKPKSISEHLLYPEKQNEGANSSISPLASQGAIAFPGAQIVEIEQQIVKGVIRRKSPRVLLTYEALNGQRQTFTLITWNSPVDAKLFDAYSTVVLASRWRAELAYLVSDIKRKAVDTTLLWPRYATQYQERYGKDWTKHAHELITEVNQIINEELDRKGIREPQIAAQVLARIAPLAPHYRQVPQLSEFVRSIEETAAKP